MVATSGAVVDHKKVLNQLAKLIEEEEICVAEIYSNSEKIAAQKEMLEIARSKTGEEFIVLIIGAFSSGKSSMINALIGEELLPTGFLPETAVIGELHYGKEKRITLFPKKGKWEGGDEPFDLPETTTEEIEKYVSLSADDAINAYEEAEGCNKHIEAKFEKMIITWPLEILKEGVVLVDSPGINDPYCNDYIVNAYLPHADAIVYVMDATKAYTKTDKEQLETINDIGRNNIITGYTFYDVIIKQSGRKPEKLEKLRNTLITHMDKHSDLGDEAIHFLDSMDGLQARIDGDIGKLRSSGYEGLENYLGSYLVEGKGKSQVKNMGTTIVKQADIMIKDAGSLNSAAEQNVVDFKKRVADAEGQLMIARSNSFNTGRNYRNHLENYLPRVEIMVSDFLKKIPEQVDLEGFEPETQLPDGSRKLWPFGEDGAKKRAKAIQEECQHEIERRMNTVFKKWSNQNLSKYLKDAVAESTQAIRPDLDQIARELNEITSMLSGDFKSSDGTIGNIAVGLAYAMLTGDWFTGGMSAIYGKGAMARGIAAQAGAGVALGVLLVAGAPITLPMVVIASIGASIASILLDNNKKKVEKIKVQAVKSFREQFATAQASENINNMVSAVMDNVRDYIEGACKDMESALAQDIKATENSMNQIIEESKLGKEEKQAQIETRNKNVNKLKKIQKQALDICREYNITDIAAGI